MLQPTEIEQLKQFHATHFPGQRQPELTDISRYAKDDPDSEPLSQSDVGDGLGYYEDGVKRTLTEDQVKMFRHSEIQRLLKERRAAREREEKQRKRQLVEVERPKAQRRSDDRPSNDNNSVDTLMYDDQPEAEVKSVPQAKTFMWPKLGGR
jgi:hypothetical protein